MSTEQLAAQSSHPMEFLLNQEFELTIPQEGQTCEGVVVAHSANDVLVDIGAKSEGIITGREVESLDPKIREKLAVGNQISVYVVSTDGKDGNIILSYGKAKAEEDWDRARQLLEDQEMYEGEITGYNRGGLLTGFGQLRAFIPASQIGIPAAPGTSSEEHLQSFVGRKLQTKVIEVDRERNRLILSARAAARETRERRREKLLEQLKKGDICEGRVVNLESFGAFVDMGGLQGLVHLSELSWKRVNKPSDELKLGEKVKVYVLNVDREKQRVALSIKRLLEDPWTTIEEKYQIGQLATVTITKIEHYGAFARLNDKCGLEGLIHISELAEERVRKPSEIVNEGDVVTIRIIRIDPKKRQLGLSLKQVVSDKYLELDLANAENNARLTANDENGG